MNLTQSFSNRQIRAAYISVGILGLFYLVLNLFVIGGDEFIYRLNTLLVIPLSIITSGMAITLWRQMRSSSQNRTLWSGLLIGWVFWAVAEFLWATYSILGQDPYPSWADFFFLMAYIPFSVGFLSRVRSLPKSRKSQGGIVWAISLIVILVTTVFVLIPILQDYSSEKLLESFLGLFYPMGDLFLLLLALNLFFTYGPGDYGAGWRLILVGFITVTFSDLFYTYADWNGLYYPDLKATWMSTFGVDVPYNISYVLWTLGIYVLFILLREHRAHKINFQPKPVSDAHILLFTKRDGTIIDVSHNYHRLFHLSDVQGKPLAETLGISKEQENIIHQKLLAGKKLTDEPIQFVVDSGTRQEGWLCGLAIINPENEYSGATILLRTLMADEAFDDIMSEHQKSMVSYVLSKSGSNENNEAKQLFWDYHLAYIKSLFNMALGEGGATMSQSLLEELQVAAQKHGWDMQFNPQTILEDTAIPFEVLKEALPALLEVAKQFLIKITDGFTAEAQLQEINSQFSEVVHKNIERFGKPDQKRSN
jgi:hypothetical protein